MEGAKMSLRDAVYGAAVGDALGVPYEFKGRDSFRCADMVGGGTHGQKAGMYSDDTAMMLATCDSIREVGAVDCEDMRRRFVDWMLRGRYSPGGVVFDIGCTVSRALDSGKGCSGEMDNGNGSLMRIVPLAFTDASDDEVMAVSAITHAHKTSMEACVRLVHIAMAVEAGAAISEAVEEETAYPGWDWLADVPSWEVGQVRSGGYVLDTLGAAIWCLVNSSSYSEAVLKAVNLGSDTDTTACVAGSLAGIAYGYDAIPEKWIKALRGKDIIESCLF